MVDSRRMNSFKFDQADLQANHSGQLSERQESGIQAPRAAFGKSGIPYGLVMMGIGLALALVALVISGLENGPQPVSTRMILGPIVLLLGLLILLLRRRSQSGLAGVSQDVVRKAEGPINIVKVEQARSGATSSSPLEHHFVYELHIGDKSFAVDGSLANVMDQEDVYAVYYDAFTDKILSAELVSKAT